MSIVVDTPLCRAHLTGHGAQVCEWTPAGQSAPVLFLSPRAVVEPGKAIRGGVPLCFPWFGPHPTDPGKPAHGFARIRDWQASPVTRDDDGNAVVQFSVASDAATRALWDASFEASVTVTLGRALAVSFEATNTGVSPVSCEVALHTYLTVGDIATVRVHGLERAKFLDRTDGLREKTSGEAPITFPGEVDRTYVGTTARCIVEDPAIGRRIVVEKSGSPETVVWNPGPERGPAMADLGAEAWRRFVCVEAAHCGAHVVHLAPGARHAIATRVFVAQEDQ